jgi:hypothetical protein
MECDYCGVHKPGHVYFRTQNGMLTTCSAECTSLLTEYWDSRFDDFPPGTFRPVPHFRHANAELLRQRDRGIDRNNNNRGENNREENGE